MPDRAASTPLRSLRLLGVLSIVVPLAIFAILGTWRFSEARQEAELRVSRSLRVAHDHATKVLGGAEALQDRLFDQVRGHTAAELRRGEPRLNAMLRDFARDQPQIQSLWLIGADGRPIATNLFLPVPAIDYSDRPYFKFHAQGRLGRYLSAPLVTRTTQQRIVDVSLRFDDAQGNFAGVINVSLLAGYFEQFYSDLVADEPGLAVNLFRRDGAVYTRWPPLPGAPDSLSPTSPTMQAIAAGRDSAQVRGISSIDGQDRLIAFRRVGNYPLYVGTGMNLSVQRDALLRQLAVLFALGMPPFVALFFAARVALHRTREAFEAATRLERETATRRRAEEALLQSQKLEALGRLTGGVAHDFNNALMVISNNLFLLRRGPGDATARQLDSIGRAVDSATRLTRQLLAFSRRQALVPQHVRLQDALPAMRDLMAPVMGGQIRVDLDVAPDTASILADPAELELALLNLAINARDAMPSGGSFSLSARNVAGKAPSPIAGAAVVIEARDSGVGIEPALLDKVFEPFFTTKPVGQGTGLGLSQVYGLCARAGGTATVASQPGAGTVVSLFFPAAPAGASTPAPDVRTLRRDLNRFVLLVEDNDEVADVLGQLLRSMGCDTVRLSRASAARDWIAQRQAEPGGALPDIVLSDVVMPGDMDGVSLALHLREQAPGLPVLLMTGYAEQMDAINAQGFEVLPKPCTPEMLGAAIDRVARRKDPR